MRKVCIHIPLVTQAEHHVELPIQFNNVRKIRLVSYSVQFVNHSTMQPAPNNLFTSVNVGLPVLEGHLKTTQKVDGSATGSESRLRLPVNLGDISTIEHPNLLMDLGGSKIIRKQFKVNVAVDPFLIHKRYEKYHTGSVDDLFMVESLENPNVSNRATSFSQVYDDYSIKDDQRVYPSLKIWLVVNETSPLLNPLANMFNSVHNSLKILAQSHEQLKDIHRQQHLTQIQHLQHLIHSTR